MKVNQDRENHWTKRLNFGMLVLQHVIAQFKMLHFSRFHCFDHINNLEIFNF